MDKKGPNGEGVESCQSCLVDVNCIDRLKGEAADWKTKFEYANEWGHRLKGEVIPGFETMVSALREENIQLKEKLKEEERLFSELSQLRPDDIKKIADERDQLKAEVGRLTALRAEGVPCDCDIMVSMKEANKQLDKAWGKVERLKKDDKEKCFSIYHLRKELLRLRNLSNAARTAMQMMAGAKETLIDCQLNPPNLEPPDPTKDCPVKPMHQRPPCKTCDRTLHPECTIYLEYFGEDKVAGDCPVKPIIECPKVVVDFGLIKSGWAVYGADTRPQAQAMADMINRKREWEMLKEAAERLIRHRNGEGGIAGVIYWDIERALAALGKGE